MATLTQYYGTGRRKTSVARVFLRPGTGKVTINRRTLDSYFHSESQMFRLRTPMQLTNTVAIARALIDYDPSFYEALRAAGLLTRDAREVERKKYGQPGARKRFQFSKR